MNNAEIKNKINLLLTTMDAIEMEYDSLEDYYNRRGEVKEGVNLEQINQHRNKINDFNNKIKSIVDEIQPHLMMNYEIYDYLNEMDLIHLFK